MVAGLVVAVWLVTSYQTNLGWMQTGRRASAAVAQVMPIIDSLPRDACVEILRSRHAEMLSDNRVQLDAVARVIADRPDLQVITPHLREAAAGTTNAPPLPSPQYHIVWTSDGQARLKRVP